MRGTEIYGILGEAASHSSAYLVDTFLEQYTRETNEMFARLHATAPNGRDINQDMVRDYMFRAEHENEKQENGTRVEKLYSRYQFKNKGDAQRFAAAMTAKGVKTAMPDVKLHGHYLVEIEKNANIKENGVMHLVNTQTLVDKYSQENGEAVASFSASSTYGAAKDNAEMGTAFTGILISEITAGFGDMGRMYSGVKRFNNQLRRYGNQNQNDAFKSRLSRGTDGSLHGGRFSGVADRYEKSVLVLNENVVIMDGKVVTDPKLRKRALDNHADRKKFMVKYQKEMTSRTIQTEHGEKIEIKQTGFRHQLRFSDTNQRIRQNTQDIQKNIKAQSYSSGEHLRGRYGRTDDTLFVTRDKFGREAIMLRQTAGTITISEEMRSMLESYQKLRGTNLSKTQNAFLDKVLEQSSRSKKYGEDKKTYHQFTYDDKINMTNVITQMTRDNRFQKTLTEEQQKALQFENREAENGGQFRLSEQEYRMFQGGTVKAQLDAIREDLGIDLNFEKSDGERIRAIELTHVDKDLTAKLAACGVTFDEASGGFMKDGAMLDRQAFRETVKADDKKLAKVFDDKLDRAGFSMDEDGTVVHNRHFNVDDKNGGLSRHTAKTLERNGIEFDVKQGTFVKVERNSAGEMLTSKALDKDELKEHLDRLAGEGKIGKNFQKNMNNQLQIKGIEIMESGKLRQAHAMDIREMDILKLDKAFLAKAEAAGYQFIRIDGKFDTKSFGNLSKADLQKIGISQQTHEALLQFHSDNWGKNNHKFGESVMSGAVKISSKMMGGDQESVEAVQTFQKIYDMKSHIQKVHVYAKQYSDAAQMRIDTYKMKHNKGGADAKSSKKPQKNKPKTENKALRRTVNTKRNEKYLDKEERALLRMKRSEKRGQVLHKFNLKDRAFEKFAKTGLGKKITAISGKLKLLIGKVVGVALGGYFVIGGGVLLLCCVLLMIQSLVGLPFKGMMALVGWISTDDIAMVELYQYMSEDLQEPWLEGLRDYDAYYDSRYDFAYTLSYDDYATYLNTLNHELFDDGSTLYINPFRQVGDETVVPRECLTPVSAFDGKNTAQIMANPSIYGERVRTSAVEPASTESGHTSNIKDILAMTDVLYEFDVDAMSDDSLQSILQQEPAQIDFANFCHKVASPFKWIGGCVAHIFGWDGSDHFPSISDYWSGTVSYATIQNYCTTLYQTSHQEQVALDVTYYPMDSVDANVDGSVRDISHDISQNEASLLGVCNSPVRSDFKIAYNGTKMSDKIYPYLLNASGNKVDLSSYSNVEHPLYMDGRTSGHCVDDVANICLWDSMAEDRATYDRILGFIDDGLFGTGLFSSDNCWKRESKTEDYERYTATGGWFDDEDDAADDAKRLLHEKSNYYSTNTPAVAREFSLAPTHDSFTRIWKESAYKNERRENSEIKTVPDGYEWRQRYWTSGTGKGHMGGNIGWDSGNGTDIMYFVVWTEGFDYSCDGEACSKVMNGDSHVLYWAYADNYSTMEQTVNDAGENVIRLTNYTPSGIEYHDYAFTGAVYYGKFYYQTLEQKYKQQYRATYSADVLCTYTEVFSRDCKGHPFEYCGGHVGCHISGIVYSVTNEQLCMCGAYDDKSEYPQAMDFDMTAHDYTKIKGKVSKADIDYSTPDTAAHSGGCDTPEMDVQGSVVNRGLNLYEDGENMKNGMEVRHDVQIQGCRDIFDIDCMIDKGKNVFPWKNADFREYQGWNADNITLVASRIATDWNDLYEFDVPLEIGAVSLSDEDIELILDGLDKEYGSTFTDTRREAVKMALGWVGRGHYSANHQEHDFLRTACRAHTSVKRIGGVTYTTSYDANCTAGDGNDFVNFYLAWHGKVTTGGGSGIDTSQWHTFYSPNTLYPADIFHHKPVSDFTPYPLESGFFGLNLTAAALTELSTHEYGIYIGTLNDIFTERGVTEIELSNGYVLHKGVPITIEMSNHTQEGCGTVFFRSEESNSYMTVSQKENFYWFLHPDASVEYRRFE